MQSESSRLCACGCGQPVPPQIKKHPERPPVRFVKGHNKRSTRPNVICETCGAAFWPDRDARRYCSVACRAIGFRGSGNPIYKGRVEHGDGYVLISAPGHPMANRQGYVYEHRLVLHQAGIVIPDGYDVHHVNGDRGDNRLDNLVVVSKAEHGQHHSNQRWERVRSV